jgi:hypothetical protein
MSALGMRYSNAPQQLDRFRGKADIEPLTSPELAMTFTSRACSTTDYQGSRVNFLPTVRLAFHNCHED